MIRRSAISRRSGVGRWANGYFLAEKKHRDESTQATQAAGRKGEHPCTCVCRTAAPIEHDAKQPCADPSATETNSGIESHHRSGVAVWKSGGEQKEKVVDPNVREVQQNLQRLLGHSSIVMTLPPAGITIATLPFA